MTHELAKYRRVLLLTELVGVVHDIGKLAEDLDKKGKTVRPYINHLFIPYIELNNLEEIKNLQFENDEQQYTQYSKYGAKFPNQKLQSVFSMDEIKRHLSNVQYFLKISGKYLKISAKIKDILKDLLKDEKVQDLFKEYKSSSGKEEISFSLLILRHHSRHIYHEYFKPNSDFSTIISDSDTMDSIEDRFEKEDKDGKKEKKIQQRQMKNVSSVFGADKGSNESGNLTETRFKVYDRIDSILTSISNPDCDDASIHADIMNLQVYLNRAAAMSVLPENDTTVWDHGFMVGSIAKASVAGRLIGTEMLNILSIQYPGRDYLTEIYRLPDFVGRAEGLQQAHEQVKSLIEVEFCMGNLVYSDVNGMYFIIPDLTNSTLKDELESRIKELYTKLTQLTPFISYKIAEKNGKYFNFGNPVVELKKSFETNFKRRLSGIKAKTLEVQEWCYKWDGKDHREVCHVCKRRPVTYISEERYEGDKLCNWCKDIREQALTSHEERARFIDQIIDENHRFVLLTGDIGLFDLWLQGDYIRTTRLEHKDKFKRKKASPSRIRGVIVEAEEFQSDVEALIVAESDLKGIVYNHRLSQQMSKEGFWSHSFNPDELRRIIIGELRRLVPEDELEKTARLVFERITFNGTKYKLFVKRKGNIADGVVAYSKNVMPGITKEWPSILKAILSKYFAKPRLFELESKQKKKEQQDLVVFLENYTEITKARKVYGMADEFMYLLPANQAINILTKIEDMFDERFGRVKGRLSLNLGLVYSDHKYPLYLVLDAGKRMLKEFREAVIREKKFNSNQSFEGLSAKLRITPQKTGNINEIIFDDPLLKDEKILYETPDSIKVIPRRGGEQGIKVDDFYAGVISLEGTPQMLNCTKISSFKKPTEIPILYAPHLIDFEYLDNVRSRIQLALDKSSGEWRKRKHLIPQLRKRPYIRETFCELIKFNEELNKYSVSSTALKKLEFGLVEQFQRLFHDEEVYLGNRGFLPDLVESLIMCIDSVKKFYQSLDVVRRAAWVEMICDGRFFDLMELRTFIQAFPERED